MNGDQNYALSHAIFDEDLYQTDPNFNLEKAFNMKAQGINESNNEMYRRFYNCMWYRENDYEPVEKQDLRLPKDAYMIVGHTPQKWGGRYATINEHPIFYVDNSTIPGIMMGLKLNTLKFITLGKINEIDR